MFAIATVSAATGLEPGSDQVEAILFLAQSPGVFGVHLQAAGAPVDLRRTDLHQFQEPRVQAGVMHHLLESEHGGRAAGSTLA